MRRATLNLGHTVCGVSYNKGHGRRKLWGFAWLPSLLLEGSSVLLLRHSLVSEPTGLLCGLKSSSSVGIPQNSSPRLGLLRYLVLCTAHILDPWPLCQKIPIAGVLGPQPISHSNNIPLMCILSALFLREPRQIQ